MRRPNASQFDDNIVRLFYQREHETERKQQQSSGNSKQNRDLNANDDASAGPRAMHGGALMTQTKLVARHETQLGVGLWERQMREPLRRHRHVPAQADAGLRLRLLHLAIVVGLELDERTEDVLVLVGVVVAQQHRMRLVVGARPLEIVERRRRIRLPQLLEFVDLRRRHLARRLVVRRHGDEPRQEGAIVDQRQPLLLVPVDVLETGRVRARLATQQHDDRLCFRRNEAEHEHVSRATKQTMNCKISIEQK